ncbi:hypothetical protein [Vibrio phage vB_pir03]|nr:hypothetical protein [Vibrio phage vB_pir03]
MAYPSIRAVFDEFSNLTVDKNFIQKLTFYVYGFINKNETHTAHFGSNLVGVRPVRYVDADAIRWLEDILGIDEKRDCQQALFTVEHVEKNHRVRSDIVNLSFIYIMHRIAISKLDQKTKDEALILTIIMNLSKHMCSLLSHRFKFPSDEIIAQQLYESLDNKSHLKRYGSWFNMMRNTALEMLEPKGIHTARKTWQTMARDKDVLYMCGDIQDRLAGQINLLTEKYHEIKNNSDRLTLNSPINSIEGEAVLAEFISKERHLVKDMLEIAKDPRDFIRDELVDATLEIISTAEETHFRRTLNYLADNVSSVPAYQETVSKLVVFILTEARQGRINLNQASEIIGRLRSTMRSSRVKKKDALELKEIFRTLVEDAIPTARDPIKVATQIAVMIYIALRMLTINRYR